MHAKYRSLVVAASLIVCSAVAATAADNIGVTAAVTNKVTGTFEGKERSLGIGSGVFQDDTIDTWKESTTQLLFLDETALTMGPDSSMVLDKFVLDPDSNTSDFVLSTTKGAFRFITGSVDPSSYLIKTPIATMGVRGTIIEWRVNKNNVLLKLVYGAADICNTGGSCISLDRPGTYVITDGSEFSDVESDDTSGTIVLEEADNNLYTLLLGSKRFVPLQNIPQQAALPNVEQPKPPPVVTPPVPPPLPPPLPPPVVTTGLPPFNPPSSVNSVMGGNSPPPGLLNNKSPGKAGSPPGQLKKNN